LGAALAGGGDLEGQEALLLASTSPQRKAILEQLAIPFEAVAPRYEESSAGFDPVVMVKEHARGKARSVAHVARGRPVLGVDTAVVLDGRVFGKPAREREAAEMLRALGGRAHEVISGLCLLGEGFEVVDHDVTRVLFRTLSERTVQAYVASGEWHGRAGAYAIQGLGASLVARIEGDYLNVVGLPAALLVRLLGERLPAAYYLA
jgi:septum formation protein